MFSRFFKRQFVTKQQKLKLLLNKQAKPLENRIRESSDDKGTFIANPTGPRKIQENQFDIGSRDNRENEFRIKEIERNSIEL